MKRKIDRQWAEEITEAWNGTLRSIIQTGKILQQAQTALPHGKWGKLVKDALPFSRCTAYRLIMIAKHPLIGNVAHGIHLPPNWRTLFVLAQLQNITILDGFKSGKIHPEMTRYVAERLLYVDQSDSEDVETSELRAAFKNGRTLPPAGRIEDARKSYLKMCKSLSPKERYEELQICMKAFCYPAHDGVIKKLDAMIFRDKANDDHEDDLVRVRLKNKVAA